jgi:hypothetical protein
MIKIFLEYWAVILFVSAAILLKNAMSRRRS